MEAEIKFLDGLDVEAELTELWNESLSNRVSSQRNYVAKRIEEELNKARNRISKTCEVSFSIADIGGICLDSEIVQELNKAHWKVDFENSTYRLTPCKFPTGCKSQGRITQ